MLRVGISIGISQMYCKANACSKISPNCSRESSRESSQNQKSCPHSGKELSFGGDGSKRYCFCNVCKKTIDNGYN